MTNSEKDYTEIPINDKLKVLGVTKFARQGDLVQIIVRRHRIVSFNIHPKEFQRTMERFRGSALNSAARVIQRYYHKDGTGFSPS